MKVRFSGAVVRRLSTGLVGLALVATPTLTGTATAMPVTPEVPCLAPTESEPAPASRFVRDSPAMLAAMDRRAAHEGASARLRDGSARMQAPQRTAALPVFRVKVQIHIIRGNHRRDRDIGRKGARRAFRVLQAGFDGGQSSASEQMGVVFDLKRITITRNDRWFHAAPMSRADKQMKRSLHRGTAQTLNLYINRPRLDGGVLLGFARFPWQYHRKPKLDGVTVHVESLPGGTARPYNLGDTVVHETGHWLGLLHTFQDGCDSYNDGVEDTPRQREENFRCLNDENLCPLQLLDGLYDPAVNFMNYTWDTCMRLFTAGQHVRLSRMWNDHRRNR